MQAECHQTHIGGAAARAKRAALRQRGARPGAAVAPATSRSTRPREHPRDRYGGDAGGEDDGESKCSGVAETRGRVARVAGITAGVRCSVWDSTPDVVVVGMATGIGGVRHGDRRRPGPRDAGGGHAGLFGIVRTHLDGEALSDVWVFFKRNRTDLKILWFEHAGLVIADKKRAQGGFGSPR